MKAISEFFRDSLFEFNSSSSGDHNAPIVIVVGVTNYLPLRICNLLQ